MTESQLLNRFKEEQTRFAVQALKQPAQRDAFEYGYRAGVFAGLEQAITILLKVVEEDNSREF